MDYWNFIWKYFINKKNPRIFLSKNVYLMKKWLLFLFLFKVKVYSHFFRALLIQVVKIGIFEIMRHKLCNCLPKFLVINPCYLFFLMICLKFFSLKAIRFYSHSKCATSTSCTFTYKQNSFNSLYDEFFQK